MDDAAKTRIPVWQLVFTPVFLTVFALLTIWLGGDWKWFEGWLFVSIFWTVSMITSVRMYLKDPGLFKERFSPPIQKDQKPWDKIVIFLVITSYLIWLVVSPLDARRFGWSPEFAVWLKAIGALVAVSGFWLFYETFKENTFAAPVIKMQSERRQHVISTGVYGFVRHPLYLGAVLYVLGGSLLMGSLYGLFAAAVFAVVLALRSIGEEGMLRAELKGYEEYTHRVRWRLVPFIF